MQLKNKDYIRSTGMGAGGLLSYRETKVSDLDLEGTEQGISFQHADACNLKRGLFEIRSGTGDELDRPSLQPWQNPAYIE